MGEARILHFLTPLQNVSPFDVNMAYDAEFIVASYTHVTLQEIPGLTQDAMFSRAPQDAAKTVLFIGGRDAMLAFDMAEAARKAIFPPFQISIFTDPSGAFTTAAAMIAVVEKHLKKRGTGFSGTRVAVFGAKGAVGGIAAVLAVQAGAQVTMVAHDRSTVVHEKAANFRHRFGLSLDIADGSTEAGRRAVIAEADIILAAAKAGVQAVSRAELEAARHLKIAADVNAVPPSGVSGLEAKADGTPLGVGDAVGIGALAIGNIKFRVQHELLRRLHDASKAQFLDFRDAYAVAREIAA